MEKYPFFLFICLTLIQYENHSRYSMYSKLLTIEYHSFLDKSFFCLKISMIQYSLTCKVKVWDNN